MQTADESHTPEDSGPTLVPDTAEAITPPSRLRLAVPMLFVIAGMSVLGILSYLEHKWIETVTWKDALISRSTRAVPEGSYPTASRNIDTSNFPPESAVFDQSMSNALGDLNWSRRERLTAIEMPDAVWESILESGNIPAPNSMEVLAGPLCRLEEFTVAFRQFKVVGRIEAGTPGLSFSYLCRKDATTESVFAESNDPGWIDPIGQTRDLDDSDQAIKEDASFLVPMAPVSKMTSYAALAAIALIVLGCGITLNRTLHRLSHRYSTLAWMIAPALEYRGLFIAIHAVCYGSYFGASLLAIRMPIENLNILMIVSEIFTQGDLSHIGDAYLSGNVFSAAWATFWNNFVVQTFMMSILPSLIIPFAGVLKTVFSLLLAGFVLSPIWVGYTGKMTFHSVTLSLECQAYVFAAFAISVYVVYMVRWFGGDRGALNSALRAVISGTVLSATILFAAGLYEAVTLIAWN